MIATSLAAICSLALIVWTFLPLLGRWGKEMPAPDHEAQELIERKANLFRSILDLDLDHKLGKLPDDDHRSMRKQLEAEAITILRSLDRFGLADSEELLEREIAEARAGLRR